MSKMLQPLAVVVVAGFFVLAIWRNPATAAQDFGSVLANIGNFLQDGLAKIAEFLGNLGG